MADATPLDGSSNRGPHVPKQAEEGELAHERLPKTDAEVELLKPAIAELLRTIPETWAEFNLDALTAIQANALYLLTVAGMVERRGWVRVTSANHPTCFEWRFQATGECGFARAVEKFSAITFQTWADAWRAWRAGETGHLSPLHCEALAPQEWRLTADGILARNELANDAQAAVVFDFVLKRGFFGPGFWIRKLSIADIKPLTDDDKRTLARHQAAGDDLATLLRPPVVGEGWLVEIRKLDQPTAPTVVNVGNWSEGAKSFAQEFAQEFGKVLEAKFEGLAAVAAAQSSGAAQDKTAGAPTETAKPRKAKRSTQRGDARVKLIAALTKHHQYADGGCLNLEPIGSNELARQADVSESRASDFFSHEFGGHEQYMAICRSPSKLTRELKRLNGEFSRDDLYGAKPPGESEREDDE